PLHRAGSVGLAAELVEARQERLAIAEAVERDVLEDHVGLDLLALGGEGSEGRAEAAGSPVVPPGAMLRARRKADRRRHRGVDAAFELAQDRANVGPATLGLDALSLVAPREA